MKRYVALVLSLILIISFAACGGKSKNGFYDGLFNTDNEIQTESPSENVTEYIPTDAPATEAPIDIPAESSITPLLYKVTDDKNNTLWLFGSIHVGMDYFYPLPEYVLDAYKNSDALAVEADMVAFSTDITAQTNAVLKLLYQDGTNIKDHLPEETYEKAVEVLTELGIYYSVLDMYMPFMWSSTIENELVYMAGYDSELGIDMFFLNDAHDTGKKILEVESAEFQYNMMANFSEELQALLLEETLLTYDNPELHYEDLDTLVELWTSGDEKGISEYLSAEGEFENKEEEKLYEEYNTEMVVKRNLSMADFAVDAIESGEEVFICVGAAHVVGEGGMADILAEKGYKVEIVR